MLVVTRLKGQAIKIGDLITVYVSDVEAGKVRLAIQAPPDVRIFREEVLPHDHPARKE